MIRIFRSLSEMCFSSLLAVYEDSFKHNSSSESKFLREQEFYQYLRSCFFTDYMAFYAVLEHMGDYLAALRIEPYKDGVLLEGLETAPEARMKGYATQLVQQTLAYLSDLHVKKVYSHVDKKNTASIRVHKKCGFSVVSDSAIYIDGSFTSGSYTYMLELNKEPG